EAGSFPWHVYFESTVCGGALVSDRWVLTSATCVESAGGVLRLNAGGTDLNSPEGWRGPLEARQIVRHPSFSGRRAGFDGDVALVRLGSRVEAGRHLSPVCLPSRRSGSRPAVGKVGYISGFGRTERFAQSDVLMFAAVPVVEEVRCGNLSSPARHGGAQLTNNMLCAGSPGIDACTGDGGGAYVFEDPLKPDTYYVAGIVSWGIQCGAYGIYTNVINYLDWIEKTMAEEGNGQN
ncbi:hypothetical protein chiPu_0028268, partial [Chiloscyllium punctatum]|nr:hypothetical protein [Chiloscyllium punctatum]